ncbi:hypothetical protein OIB37_23700 [Streptomyces sp. NBC_00820]|uniref:SseB family protein n=1 Tax=Streptomyces sp. NBC_00820 TaxID=2975842 RepID=UPI002ED37F70|nr:hypothetical protein OIB37_23700 [Streptomyces sp. NBC_00820]
MTDEPTEGAELAIPRSKLTDIADGTVVRSARAEPGAVPCSSAPELSSPSRSADTPSDGERSDSPANVIKGGPSGAGAERVTGDTASAAPSLDAQAQARRLRFLAELGEFRRSRVLVPVGALPAGGGTEAPLTVDEGGVRWILAFTGEEALARFALLRGQGARPWPYLAVWGAALLDAAVPEVARTGVPCGVVVDAADGERALVLPPVVGVVPEEAAVDGSEFPGVRSGDADGPDREGDAGAVAHGIAVPGRSGYGYEEGR